MTFKQRENYGHADLLHHVHNNNSHTLYILKQQKNKALPKISPAFIDI